MKKSNLCLEALIGFMVLFLFGCASQRPVLYPNAYYRHVGSAQADKDIAQAMETAKNGGADENGDKQKSLGRTVTDSTARAGVGVAADAVKGGMGSGTIVGAAGSGSVGILNWMLFDNGPDPVFKKFVEMRLQEKGYQVIGWK